MSDITMEAAIRLSAEDRASAVIRNLQRDVDALRRSLAALSRIKLPSTASTTGTPSPASQALDFRAGAQALANAKLIATTERQAARQREADTRAHQREQRKMESESLRALRTRDAATAKALRDQLAAQRLLERETRRAAAAAERAHDADLRRQSAGIRFLAGLRARHDRDERRAAAQAERDREDALRRQIAGDRWRFGLRDRMERQERRERDRAERDVVRHSRETWHRGRDALHDTFRPAGLAALASTAATVAGTRRVLGAERDVDAAEINTRAYGGLTFDAARELREKWAAPTAESFGSDTAKLLTAWTDATKLGTPATGAKAFAELSTKTSEAWEVPFEQVTDIFGTINTLLTSQGQAFDPARLKSVANTLQHLAAKQSTTPEKMISFLQRGAGAAQVLGMSQESGLAFGSASTSLGNQAGMSGRMFDYIASRVIELPRLVKGDGEQAEQARALVKALGYGSAAAMDKQRRVDPDEFLPDFMERFARIKDQRKQDQAIRFFTGREWLGEFGRMVKGADTYREAVKLAKEAKGLDAIGAVWELHKLKLGFVMKQFRAGWLNILGEFGKTLSPLARQAGDYFLEWSSKLRAGGLQARFKAVLDGLLDGFGFKDLPDALNRLFGKPGAGNAGALETWKATAREFASGLRDVFGGIGDLLKSFTGGSPEIIARWSGRILALGAALVVLSPVLTVLGGLASGIVAISAALGAGLAALKAAGLVGGAGTAAGAISATVWATAGGLIGAAFLATIANKLNILSPPDMSKGWGRGILEFLDPGLARRILGDAPATAEQEKRQGDGSAEPPARVERQSHNGAHDSRPTPTKTSHIYEDDGRPLTTRAARIVQRFVQPPATENDLGTHNGAFDRRYIRPAALDAGDDTMRQLLHRVATFTAPSAGSALDGIVRGSSGGVPSFPGSSPAGAPGLPAGPSTSPRVPAWFNRGNGTQGGGINPPNAAGPKGPHGDRMKSVYTAFRSTGLGHEAAKSFAAEIGRENDYNADLMFGSHLDPHNRKRNAGMMSWQGDRATKLLEHLRERGQLNADGSIRRTQEALNAQAEFAVGEMRSGALGARGKRAMGTLNDPNTSHQQRALALGDDVIRWRQHDPRYAHHARKRDQYYAQLGGLTEGAAGAGAAPNQAEQGDVAGGVHPLDGKGRFTSDFGMRRHPITGAFKMHNGLDLAAPGGTPVKAMKAGTVSLDRSGDVTVKADDGSSTTYRHIQAQVEAGARIAAGQAIGRLRAHDPRSTGPHLHFESRDARGGLLDPKGLLAPREKAIAERAPTAGPDALEFMKGRISSPRMDQPVAPYSKRAFDPRSVIGAPPGELTQRPSELIQRPTVDNLLSKMPAPPKAMPGLPSPSGQGRGGDDGMTQSARSGAGATFHIVNNISGAGESPQGLAAKVQQHIAEAWNYRSHDLEPELT